MSQVTGNLFTLLGVHPGLGRLIESNTPLGLVMAMPAPRAEGLERFPRMNGPFVNLVTPNFFAVAGLRIRDGRGFADRDRAGTQKVAVVNSTFARLVWPVRTRGSPARTVPPVLVALGELFPHLPAGRVQSLPAVFAPRIRTWTIGAARATRWPSPRRHWCW